jgi:hypothetical protein
VTEESQNDNAKIELNSPTTQSCETTGWVVPVEPRMKYRRKEGKTRVYRGSIGFVVTSEVPQSRNSTLTAAAV